MTTATGWSGLYSDITSGGYSTIDGKMPRRNSIRRVVNRGGFRALTALFNGLIGAASGSNVTATHKQIASVTPFADNGGARTISTISDINRNTTAADITALKEMTYNVKTRPTPEVRDLSGNGGGTLA